MGEDLMQVHELPATKPMDTQLARLQAVIEAVPAAIIVVEGNASRGFRANRLGHEVLRRMGAGDGPESKEELPNEIVSAASGVAVRDWEVRVTLSDGREHRFLGQALPLRD